MTATTVAPAKRTTISHKEHDHDNSSNARTLCRMTLAETGKPLAQAGKPLTDLVAAWEAGHPKAAKKAQAEQVAKEAAHKAASSKPKTTRKAAPKKATAAA